MARKHRTQMVSQELTALTMHVRTLPVRTPNAGHFVDRKAERVFTITQVHDAVRSGDVIEIHNDAAPDVRVLMRDDQGTCVVVSLVTRDIVTVYYNAPHDQHSTLNWSLYRWSAPVLPLLRNLRRGI